MSIDSLQTRFLDNERLKIGTEYPSWYSTLSDKGLYRRLASQGKVPKELKIEEYETGYSSLGKQSKYSQEETDSAQNQMGFLQSSADYIISENSPDWAKAAYNRSLTGMTEQMFTGKQRYNVDELDFNIGEDIAASFFSFFMPLDIATMGIGGLLGKSAAKGLGRKWMAEKVEEEAIEKAVKSMDKDALKALMEKASLTKVEKSLIGGAASAINLGIYEGAIGGIQAKINNEDVVGGIAHGVFHGAALGFLTGAAGGGMGARAAEIEKASGTLAKGKGLAKSEWWKTKVGYGIPGQVVTEASIFTAAEAYETRNDAEGESILKMLARNVGLFGALKVYGKGQQKALKKLEKTDLYKEVKDIMDGWDAEIANKHFKEGSYEKALDNVIDSTGNEQAKAEKVESKAETTAVNEVLKEVSAGLEKISERVGEGDVGKEKLERSGKEVAEIKNTLKLAEILLEKGLNGDLTKEQLEINERQRNNIEKLRGKLKELNEKITKDMEADIERQANEEPDAGLNPKFVLNKLKKHSIDGEPPIDVKSNNPKTGKPWDLTNPKEVKQLNDAVDSIANSKNSESRHGKRKNSALQKDLDYQNQLDSSKERIRLGEEKHKDEKRSGKPSTTKTDKAILNIDKEVSNKDADGRITEASRIHRNILSEIFGEKNTSTNKVAEAKAAVEFLNWVEKKYKTSIVDLSKEQLHDIVETWVTDVTMGEFAKGKERISPWETKVKEWHKRGWTDSQIQQVVSRANAMRNNILGLVRKKGLNKYTDGAFDIVRDGTGASTVKPRQTKGTGKPEVKLGQIKDGVPVKMEESIQDLADTARSQKEKIKVGKKEVGGETLANMIEFSRKHRLREGEITDIQPGDIDVTNGTVTLRHKRKTPYVIKDKAFAEFLFDYAQKHNRVGGNKVLDFTYKEFSKMIEFLAKEAGIQINVWEGTEGRMYKWGESSVETGSPVRDKSVLKIFRQSHKVKYGEGEMEAASKIRGHEGEGGIAAKRYLWQTFETLTEAQKKLIKPTKRQLELRDRKLTISKERQQSQVDYLKSLPGYSNLEVKLVKDLGKHEGKKVLGRITNHLVEVLEGRAKEDTIPHEFSHYAVDVLKQFGTSKDKALIEKGIKMFAKDLKREKGESKEKFRERQEELLVQRIGEFTAGRMRAKDLPALKMKDIKTFSGKFKYFAKQFWQRVKDVFGLHSKDDVAWMLSKKVYEGDIPTGREVYNYVESMRVHHQTGPNGKPNPANTKAKERAQKRGFALHDILIKDYGMPEADLIALREQIGFPKGAKIKDVSLSTLELWADTLQESFNKYQGRKTEIKTLAEEYQLSDNDVRTLVESMGEYHGDPSKLSSKDREKLKHLIKESGEKTFVEKEAMEDVIALSDKKYPLSNLAKHIAPVFYVLRKGGKAGNRIADRMFKWDVTYNHEFKGKGDVVVHAVRKMLGRDESLLWMMDSERVQAIMDAAKEKNKDSNNLINLRKKATGLGKYQKLDPETGLTKKEMKFLKELENGWEIKDSDGKVTSYGGSNAYMAKIKIKELYDYYWNSMYTEVSKINNKIEFEQFKKEFGKLFVENYFSRRLTKAAMEGLDVGHAALENTVNSVAKDGALKEAQRQAKLLYPSGKGKKYQAEVKAIRKRLLDKTTKDGQKYFEGIELDVYNIVTHQHHKVKNKYLMERGPLLPEFITVKDKLNVTQVVRTYETSLSKIVEPYVMTMSKYLATIRHFPEYTGLGGKYKLGGSKLEVMKQKLKDNNMGAYAEQQIRKLIGVNEGYSLIGAEMPWLNSFAHLSAAWGLSSPTSGIKNLLIGLPRTYASYGLVNTLKGFYKVLSPTAWQEAREKGALQYGAKTLELGQTPGRAMAHLFRYNLMTWTENVNRIAAMEAGKLYFSQQLNALKGIPTMFGVKLPKSWAKRAMRDIWKLSDSDIKFLTETEAFKTTKEAERFKQIMAQVEQYSHISTQGGTTEHLLPAGWSSRWAKPLTLFQRMAYATTSDMYINYVKPLKTHKNPFPLLRATMGHALGGAALYQMYKFLFNQEGPQTAQKFFDEENIANNQLMYYLWKGEFLGLFGFALDPYVKGGFLNKVSSPLKEGPEKTLLYPVVIRNMATTAELAYEILIGKEGQKDKPYKKMISDWGKNTVVLYSQADKMTKRIKSPTYSENKVMKRWLRNYMIEKDLTGNSNMKHFESPYYYKDMKEMLLLGDDKQMVNAFFAAYNAKMGDYLKTPGATKRWAHKMAVKGIKASLSSMNPINVSDKTPKGVTISKRNDFLKWVKKNYGQEGYDRILKAEKEYKFRLRKFYKAIKPKKLWLENSAFIGKEELSYE
mgnify:CR=1 FL=1|tara:strand:- start:320 stop:7252 length:6933 start_codon:yes stop_codon:yes gene_type:complete